MKVAVCARGDSLQAEVDDRFGRAQYFVMVDTESGEEEVARNPSLSLGSGAGIQSVQFLSDNGVEVIIAGNIGPKAAGAMQMAGIRAYRPKFSTVSENIEAFKKGDLEQAQDATVRSHFGSGRGRRMR
ncbi:MAG: NifB/NifX family molybdenum-iron cluster-binding protein [Bacillota bacterium]